MALQTTTQNGLTITTLLCTEYTVLLRPTLINAYNWFYSLALAYSLYSCKNAENNGWFLSCKMLGIALFINGRNFVLIAWSDC